jgi:hypothetical protein
MAWRGRLRARRHAAFAAAAGVWMIVVGGPLLLIPALALVALVYWSHHLVAVAGGDATVPYPDLAFVIVVNSAVVLLVQAVSYAADIGTF